MAAPRRVVVEDLKRESRIRVEKMPNDLHLAISRFARRRRYSKMFDALLYCASVGVTVLENGESLLGLKGYEGLQQVEVEKR